MSFLNYIRCISYCNKIQETSRGPTTNCIHHAVHSPFLCQYLITQFFCIPCLLDIIITFLVDAVICQVHALVPDVSVALLIFHCSKPVYQIKEGECICYFQVRQQIMAHKRNPGTQSIPQAHYKEIYDYKSQLI